MLTGKINLARAERDRVVTSYAVLSAVGRLTTSQVGLHLTRYKPGEHYDAVKDKWTVYGRRTVVSTIAEEGLRSPCWERVKEEFGMNDATILVRFPQPPGHRWLERTRAVAFGRADRWRATKT